MAWTIGECYDIELNAMHYSQQSLAFEGHLSRSSIAMAAF